MDKSSNSSLRLRRPNEVRDGEYSSSTHRASPTRNHPADKDDVVGCHSWMLTLVLFYASLTAVVLFTNQIFPTPKTVGDSHQSEFTEQRAREHLENIVKVGARVSGTYENDVYAVKYILDNVEEVKKAAHPSRKIEANVQRPTGSFFLAFLDDFTSYYANISNTVVKVTTPESDDNALLLNCHTDSVINAPGASDDAVACAIMLEILRAVAVEETPLLHPLIFLFNGAEENVLQASHGFITQHEWAKQVKAFINLEAAGAGGKELVFQTGPENPWLVWAWANHAPHPHGSSVGQDLFQSGLIPSDTDFRIYRDHGKIPGIDLAYVRNGYVYHTLHDTPEMIGPGCVQRAGENILGVVRHLVQSPDSNLADPSEYKHGEAAYFDFLGIYFTVIPLRLLTLINSIVIVAVLVYIGNRMLHPRITGFDGFEYNSKLLKAIAINILGYTSCFLCLAFMAAFLTRMGRSMSWYSQPWLVAGLYLPAGLMGLVTVHAVAKMTIFKKSDGVRLESVFFDASLVMWTAILFQSRQIGSSYLFLFPTLFAVLGRGFLAKQAYTLLQPGTTGSQKLLLYLGIQFMPSLLWVKMALLTFDFFIPIVGRAGTEVPSEVFMIALVGISIIGCFSYQACSLYLVNSLKWFYIVMVACLIFSVGISFSDIGFPYKNDPESPTNKRFFMQHIERDFYDFDGRLASRDAGMFVCYLDYICADHDLGPKILREKPTEPCKGTYCEMPFLLPIQKLVKKNQYIPMAPPPKKATTDQYPFSVKWEETVENVGATQSYVKVFVTVEGPPNMAVHITPLSSNNSNATLVGWSFSGDVRHAHSKHASKKTYFVYYGGGMVHPVWNFWLQFAVSSKGIPSGRGAILELAVTAHYKPSGPVSKVNRQTAELEAITNELHDWVATMTWVSLYKHFII